MRDMSEQLERMIAAKVSQRPKTIDGVARDAGAEQTLNGVCAAAFSTPAGEAVLAYVRSITVDVCLPPDASEADLRALEAMRRTYWILYRRTEAGKLP